jgi:4a-hydroxytetrahydrobiopterin dehydratase
MSLSDEKCGPCHKGEPALPEVVIQTLLPQVPDWSLSPDHKSLSREFSSFASYAAGLSFLIEIAKIADEEKHHPDLWLGYKKVRVLWTTHAWDGLSRNDFIGAAKVDALPR